MSAHILARLAAWLRARYGFHSWGGDVSYWDIGPQHRDALNDPYRWVFQLGPFELRRKKP